MTISRYYHGERSKDRDVIVIAPDKLCDGRTMDSDHGLSPVMVALMASQ